MYSKVIILSVDSGSSLRHFLCVDGSDVQMSFATLKLWRFAFLTKILMENLKYFIDREKKCTLVMTVSMAVVKQHLVEHGFSQHLASSYG